MQRVRRRHLAARLAVASMRPPLRAFVRMPAQTFGAMHCRAAAVRRSPPSRRACGNRSCADLPARAGEVTDVCNVVPMLCNEGRPRSRWWRCWPWRYRDRRPALRNAVSSDAWALFEQPAIATRYCRWAGAAGRWLRRRCIGAAASAQPSLYSCVTAFVAAQQRQRRRRYCPLRCRLRRAYAPPPSARHPGRCRCRRTGGRVRSRQRRRCRRP